ncbi:MAG: DNA-3-methyladenine glycosylase 2 family protein, partial [Lapillicoccus sp.]
MTPSPTLAPVQTRRWVSPRATALGQIVGIFRRGGGDPTSRSGPGTPGFVRAFHAPTGPTTLELAPRPRDGAVEARAWGPGAEWALETLPDLLGESDDLSDFVAHHDLVAQSLRRHAGWRVPRSHLVVDALVPAIIEQKVTGQEAFAGYRRLVLRFGALAPGPYAAQGLRVPPTAAQWAVVPSWEFLRASVDPARSRALVAAVRVAGRLEQTVDLAPGEARARLRAVPGVGVWTAAEVAQRALGDADAVSFGDYHV